MAAGQHQQLQKTGGTPNYKRLISSALGSLILLAITFNARMYAIEAHIAAICCHRLIRGPQPLAGTVIDRSIAAGWIGRRWRTLFHTHMLIQPDACKIGISKNSHHKACTHSYAKLCKIRGAGRGHTPGGGGGGGLWLTLLDLRPLPLANAGAAGVGEHGARRPWRRSPGGHPAQWWRESALSQG